MKFKTIALVDYSSFTREKKYYGSINELMDILVGKQLEVYALFPIDSTQELAPIDMDTKGVIPFSQDDLMTPHLIDETMKTTKCSDTSKTFVISLNPTLLNYFEAYGYEACRINNGYNDVVSSNAYEINRVPEIRKIFR